MRRFVVAVALLLSLASSAFAQSATPSVWSLADFTSIESLFGLRVGGPYTLYKAQIDGRPGDEIVLVSPTGTVYVLYLNAPRSGLYGSVSRPGLCLDYPHVLPPMPGNGRSILFVDTNGDGRDELLVSGGDAAGTIGVMPNHGKGACFPFPRR